MTDLKDYRKKELRYYLLANISLLLLLSEFFPLVQSSNVIQIVNLVSTFFGISLLSSTIFILSFIFDGLVSSETKTLLIGGHSPGEKIFTKIKKESFDKRFTNTDAQRVYSKVFELMPNDKREKYLYENAEWYKIYNKHRDTNIIVSSHRDYLLYRDIYFATIVNMIIYFGLIFGFKIISFNWQYLCYLSVMLIITNLGTRNKRKRFICNVIAYDIVNFKTTTKRNGE